MARASTGAAALALGALAAAVTAYQLVLMQLLAYVYGYHFAYFVVSLALLGFGASGTALFLLGPAVLRVEQSVLPGSAGLAGMLTAASPLLLDLPFLRVHPVLFPLFPGQGFALLALAFLLFLPFFLAGFFIGHVLTTRVREVGRLYASDLLGSGLGGLGGFLLLAVTPPWSAAGVAGLSAVCAAFYFRPGGSQSRWRRVLPAPAVAVVLACWLFAGGVDPAENKDIHGVTGLPDARITRTDPGTHGVLEQVESSHLRQLPGLSLAAPALDEPRPMLFLNAEAVGPLGRAFQPPDASPMRASGEQLGYLGASPRRVLVLESEGGTPLELALAAPTAAIRVAEPVKPLRRRLMESFAREIAEERLSFSARSSRAALQEAVSPAWDLIRFPTLGGPGGELGFSALGEDYLLTVEGVGRAWNQLTPSGRLLFTIWPDYPPRNLLKLLNLIRVVLEKEAGRAPRAHMLAWRGWGNINLAVFREPPGPSTLEAVRERADILQLDPLILPGLAPEDRERYHRLGDPDFFQAVDAILDGEAARDYRQQSPFRLQAPVDDRPFFAQYLKPTRLPALANALGWERLLFLEFGSVAALLTLFGLGGAAALIILLPVVQRLRRTGRPLPIRPFGYFAALGFGFMAVEIVLIQKLHLLLGNSIRAAALTLTTLLVFSGVGSLVSGRSRRPEHARRMAAIAVAIAVVVLALLVQSGLPIRWLGGAPGWVSALCCILVLAPLAFAMGFPFPLGLQRLDAAHPEAKPWAWAVNGCFSVITPPLVTLSAVFLGFATMLLLAALAYFAAATVDPGR